MIEKGAANAHAAKDRASSLANGASDPGNLSRNQILRDKAAVGALVFLVFLTIACALAPVYSKRIAHTDPFRSNLSEEITIDKQLIPVIQTQTSGLGLGTIPIGPTWHRQYLLGADNQGRDIAARLLYAGRNSLLVSAAAAGLCLTLAVILGAAAGYLGGWVDTILARIMDILWAFPIYLLAISLSIVLLQEGIHIGPFVIESDSLLLPIIIIGLVYVPYVARPVRGQVLSLRNREFVLAARGFGIPTARILAYEILPNIAPSVIVLAPLIVALSLLTESGLSFLSIGVQAPQASWGTMIQDGQELIYTRPLVAIVPGVVLTMTVVALNILGDSLRDTVDPRSTRGRYG